MDPWVLQNERMLVNVAVVGRIWQNDCLQERNGALNARPLDTVAFENSVFGSFSCFGPLNFSHSRDAPCK
jgi:hypothetical protein